jgi:hypothetical protein
MDFKRNSRASRPNGIGSNAPSPESKKEEEDTQRFTQFPQLPPELRRMIWANAADYTANEPHNPSPARFRPQQWAHCPTIPSHVTYQSILDHHPSIYECEPIILQPNHRRFPNTLRFANMQMRSSVDHRRVLELRNPQIDEEIIDFTIDRDIILVDIGTLLNLNHAHVARGRLATGSGFGGFHRFRHSATILEARE